MAQIPFPPGGPQVQAALQNPSRFPDQKLQAYAQGQQPTGQVPPPLAANELTIRNAQRQAASRQQAMQNDPSKSPTTFQQLQAREQALAQKEQQLGVMGALMAKKAQDMQAREQGIAALSMPQDMFTAMDGGIVFSGGGNVEGYASRGLVAPDLGGFNEDRPSFSVPASAPRKSKEDLEEEDILARLLDPAERLAALSKVSTLSKEDREKIKAERKKELEEQYSRYEQGIAGLAEEEAAAIRGKKGDFLTGFLSGIPERGAGGRRISDVLLGGVKGLAAQQKAEEERETKANMLIAAAKRKQAEARFAEERGRDDIAKKATDEAQALLDKAFGREREVETLATEAARAGATYLSGKDKAASQAALRERALELKQQQISINEALAQGRINQMQAQAQMAAITAELRGLAVQNAALQAQSGMLQAQSGAMDRVERTLQNNIAYVKAETDISRLLAKKKLSPEDDKELDTLIARRNAIRTETEARFGLRQPSAPSGTTVPANLPKEVKTKDGKTYTRPPGFSDEQWAQYVKEQGTK